MLIRLKSYLARAGVASRREADRLISEGRVKVNGVRVSELGQKVDDGADAVEVDGSRVKLSSTNLYLLINKPKGYLVTM